MKIIIATCGVCKEQLIKTDYDACLSCELKRLKSERLLLIKGLSEIVEHGIIHHDPKPFHIAKDTLARIKYHPNNQK